MHGYDEPVFLISVVAKLMNIHPQTLRQYEREGLLKPSRTEGRMRLYSQRDIDKLKIILTLARDMGVNLAGIDIILQLKDEIDSAIINVVESQRFILGPEVQELEEQFTRYLNVKYAYGVSSGTDALLIALMAIGIKPGGEVIVPTYSFFATAGVVARMHATPVFVDIDPVTFNIAPGKIEKKITDKTKAVVVVNLFGHPAD